MAKGRMLLKLVSTSQKLAKLESDSARLLWTWLLAHLDREGRFFAEPAVVKGHAVPRLKEHTEETIAKHLGELRDAGLILLYEVNGDRYLQYNQFDEHQQGLHKDREAASPCPPPPEKVRKRSGKGPVKIPLKVKESNINIKVIEAWNSKNIRNLSDAESKAGRKTLLKIESVLKEYSAEVVLEAIDNYGTVINSPGLYFFTYKWDLLDFLQRGLKNFVGAATPLTNYAIKQLERRDSMPPRKLTPEEFKAQQDEELRRLREKG